MKPLLITLLLTFCMTSFAQVKTNEYIDVGFILPWKVAKITLLKGSTEIYSTTSDSTTILIYQDLEPGFYKLSVTNSDNKIEYRDNILVKNGQKITANIRLENICPYQYPDKYIPICPAGHKNAILEIRYRNEKGRIKNRKYYLINYTATGCIPRFYCTKHNIKF